MIQGLTLDEVEKRRQSGLVNYDTSIKTNSVFSIVIKHIFTLFNFLNFALAFIVLYLHSYKNALFIIVVIFNTLIGIYQEIKSKKMVDKLSVLVSNKVLTIRDAKEMMISINEIVMDDILKFKTGFEIVVDCVIVEGEVEVNEAFITGEADPILKKRGDIINSGSFVISGVCTARVIHIGNDNYTAVISKEAKYIKKINSEIMISLKKIIRYISLVVVPIGIIFLKHQLHIMNNSYEEALIKMVAVMIGMIPDGLVLLTSSVLMVSVIKLARKRVLVHDLYSIENLSRVDTICFDKTGTLTTGNMIVSDVIVLDKEIDIDGIMNSLLNNLNCFNNTIKALKNKYKGRSKYKINNVKEFNSETKYTKFTLDDHDTYFLGAYEVLNINNHLDVLKKYSEDYRVLVLVSNGDLKAIFLLRDEFRKSVKNMIDYVKKQGISIKVLSGDSAITVSKIADEAGIDNALDYFDATNLKKEDINDSILSKNVFGRVTPKIKKEIIKKLQYNGHNVAMIGDGVNDVLALKQSDASIALNSGDVAAINVAEIVLIDSNFDVTPDIINEGKRTINNVTRSASLFLTKTMYNIMLAMLFVFINIKYPIIPIQFSLISAFTIGIPGFILSFENNYNPIKKGFLTNIFKVSFPFSLTIVLSMMLTMTVGSLYKIPSSNLSTIIVLVILAVSFFLLYKVCSPFNKFRKMIYVTTVILCLFTLTIFRNFYSLTLLNIKEYTILIILILNAFILTKISDTIMKKVGGL